MPKPQTIPWEHELSSTCRVVGTHIGCGGPVVYEETRHGAVRYCLKCECGLRRGWARVKENGRG